jgi:heme exporter protein B
MKLNSAKKRYALADFIHTLRRLISKELRVEFRSGGMICTSISFALCAVITAGIGYGGFIKDAKTAAVLFWIIALFTAMSPVAHLFLREEEEGTADLLRLHFPSDAVFLSKAACGTLFVLFSLGVMAPLYAGFFNLTIASPVLFTVIILAGGTSAACATSFAGAVASRAGGKGALFALLSIPAALPVLVSAVHGTHCALTGTEGGWNDAGFCLAYGTVITAVSLKLYDIIGMEE